MSHEPTVMPATKGISETASLLEEGVGKFLEARATLPQLGKYESDLEVLNLFYLVIRHIEAICTLAKRDLVMLPSAQALARAALESTIKILWMLEPENVFARESRWLSHLATEEKYLLSLARLLEEGGLDSADYLSNAKNIQAFRADVEKLLPADVPVLKSLPKVPEMMKAIGFKELYRSYVHLCQFVHGTHASTNLYRKDLGCGKKLGEFVSPELWSYPLRCCWFCLYTGATHILRRLGGKPEAFAEPAFIHSMENALKRI